MKELTLRQTGDTIIEVLLSITILGLVLGGAYALANRNLSSGISAEKRNQALASAQSQAEFIINAQNTGGSALDKYKNFTGDFCILPDGNPKAKDSPECKTYNGQPYSLTVHYSSNLFTVTANWTSANSANLEKLTLYYKLPGTYAGPGTPAFLPPAPAPSPSPAPPGSPPLGVATWVGDFETGDTSQYSYGAVGSKTEGYQCKVFDGSRGKVVSKSEGHPVRAGNYSSRQHVEPGDNNVADSRTGERCDIFKGGINAEEGNEMWYAWSTYFPSDYNPTPSTGWNLFADWHNTYSGQANQNFEYNTSPNPGVLEVRTYGGCQNCNERTWVLGPLVKNQWYDFVQHIKWSSDPSVGFLEMWMNGTSVVPYTQRATLYTGQGAYLKLANYRAAGGIASTIYHDEARAGTSRAAVELR